MNQSEEIKSAEEILNEYTKGFTPNNTFKYLALDAMHEYANQFKSEWISVKDSLPRIPDEYYLIAVKNKNKEGGIFLIDIAVFDSDGKWNQSNTWESVTHWQPLPTPPKV